VRRRPWSAPAMDGGGGRGSGARPDLSSALRPAAPGRGSEGRGCHAVGMWVRPDPFRSIGTGGEEGEAWLLEKSEP
jgi:hypothetical protein